MDGKKPHSINKISSSLSKTKPKRSTLPELLQKFLQSPGTLTPAEVHALQPVLGNKKIAGLLRKQATPSLPLDTDSTDIVMGDRTKPQKILPFIEEPSSGLPSVSSDSTFGFGNLRTPVVEEKTRKSTTNAARSSSSAFSGDFSRFGTEPKAPTSPFTISPSGTHKPPLTPSSSFHTSPGSIESKTEFSPTSTSGFSPSEAFTFMEDFLNLREDKKEPRVRPVTSPSRTPPYKPLSSFGMPHPNKERETDTKMGEAYIPFPTIETHSLVPFSFEGNSPAFDKATPSSEPKISTPSPSFNRTTPESSFPYSDGPKPFSFGTKIDKTEKPSHPTGNVGAFAFHNEHFDFPVEDKRKTEMDTTSYEWGLPQNPSSTISNHAPNTPFPLSPQLSVEPTILPSNLMTIDVGDSAIDSAKSIESGENRDASHEDTIRPTKSLQLPVETETASQGKKRKREINEEVEDPLAVVKQEAPTIETNAVESDEEAEGDDDGEIEELFEGQKFWARTTVRYSGAKALLTPAQVTIHAFSISPERRQTIYGKQAGNASLQGGHLVAWSAITQYWSNQLTGPLGNVLQRLQQWLLEDQLRDTNPENKEPRARAYQLIQILCATPLRLDRILNCLEAAASLFISTNQYSSFTVAGKSKGGNAEATSLRDLSAANSSITTTTTNAPLVVSPPAASDQDTEMENDTPSEKEIPKLTPTAKAALNLIDTKTPPSGESPEAAERTKAKAVHTWFRMLITLYPNLKAEFEQILLPQKIWQKSVTKWRQQWEDYYKDAALGAHNTLTGHALDLSTIPSQPLGVLALAEATPPTLSLGWSGSDGKQASASDAVMASQVDIGGIEIPAKLRARTQFNTQQSHTISWTFKRQALEKMLTNAKNQKADTFLTLLYDLALGDYDSFPKELNSNAKALKVRSLALCSHLKELQTKTQPLVTWTSTLNQCLVDYIEVNQAHPLSTYSGAGTATGHSEGYANKVFKKEMTDEVYAEMKKFVVNFIDLGVFYGPLVRDIMAYDDLQMALPRKEGSRSRSNSQVSYAEPSARKKQKGDPTAQPPLVKMDDTLTATASGLFQDYLNLKILGSHQKQVLLKLSVDDFKDLRKMVGICIYAVGGYDWENKKGLDKIEREKAKEERFIAEQESQRATLLEEIDNRAKEKREQLKQNLLKGLDLSAAPYADVIKLCITAELEEEFNIAKPNGATLRRLNEIRAAMNNYTSHHPSLVEETRTQKQILEDKVIKSPKKAAIDLVALQQPLVDTLIQSFYFHLKDFHPAFYNSFTAKGNTPDSDLGLQNKKNFLERALFAPLDPKEARIGSSLQTYLGGQKQYEIYINEFKSALKRIIAEKWFVVDAKQPLQEDSMTLDQ